MKRLVVGVFVVGLARSVGLSVAPLTTQDAAIQKLGVADEHARLEASQSLVKMGAIAIPALVATWDRDKADAGKMAYQTLFGIVQQAVSPEQRQEVSGFLVKELVPERSIGTRRRICELLSYVGDARSADALYPMLGYPDLQEMVRWALVRMPDLNATQALVAAMQITEWDFRIALVNAIGEKGDRRAVPILRMLAGSDDDRMCQAALLALARMPDIAALGTINQALEAKRPGAVSAFLKIGETLADAGMAKETLGVFRAMAGQASLSAAEWCRVAHGLGRVGDVQDAQTLLAAMSDVSKWSKDGTRIRGACLEALAQMAGEPVTTLLAERMAQSPDTEKVVLLGVLAQRGVAMPDEAARRIIGAASAGDETVRLAAMDALVQAGIASGTSVLLQALQGSSGPTRDAAERAINHLTDQGATERMLAGYEKASPRQKPPLLRALGHRRSDKVAALLIREAASGDTQVRSAAAAGLSRLDDPKYESSLLALAEGGPTDVKKGALAGYLTLARQKESTSASAATAMYTKALTLAGGDEQTRQALDGISRTAGPEDTDLLAVVLPALVDEKAPPEACRAAGRLAMALPELQKDQAIEILKLAAQMIPGDPMAAQIVEHLGKLGVVYNLAKEAGFITSWWLAGPFQTSRKKWDACHFEGGVADRQSKARIGDMEYAWRYDRADELRGVVDLGKTFAGQNRTAAYAGCEVTVEADQEVQWRIGSDGPIVIWVNGQKLHASKANRPLQIDQDRVKAGLKAGVNKVLVKSLHGDEGWGFCIRLTLLDGTPVRFTQPAAPPSTQQGH